MEFEWNPKKAAINVSKHKVSFHEAATVFGDPLSATVPDPDHSDDEERFLIIGTSHQSRLLIVSYCERDTQICIISARELTNAERKAYEQENP
jgi:uncharacterized protein